MTACALLPAILVGCAQHADDAGFSSVQTLAHERTGQSVRWDRNSNDAQAIANAIERLACNRNALLEMRRRAQQTARGFGWGPIAAQTIKVYHRVLA